MAGEYLEADAAYGELVDGVDEVSDQRCLRKAPTSVAARRNATSKRLPTLRSESMASFIGSACLKVKIVIEPRAR